MTLKEQILQILNSQDFPNLEIIFSDEALDLALEILNEELVKEKQKFKDLLKTKNEDLTFDSFENDGILDYYWALLNHLENVNSSEKTRKIIEKFRPKLEDFGNEVAYSKPYFEKLVYVDDKLKINLEAKEEETNNSNLSSDNLSEQKRIMYLSVKAYKDRGINLSDKKQKRLKEINKKLGKLSDKFSNNVVDDEKKFEYLITDFEVIKDLPKEVIEIAKKKFQDKKQDYKDKKEGYLFDSDPTSCSAIMKYCSDSKIRQDFEKANYTTASSGKFDNRKVVLELLKLKNEKAKILGYKNYAELSLNSKMADSPKDVFKLLKTILKKAKNKAKLDLKELKEYFKLEKIHSYDVAYYSRILKEQKYEVDEKELKKYFEFENVLDYLHRFVEKFYNIEIKQVSLKSYDSEVRIYEVYKGKSLISYYFLDAFYRQGKRHGAWADNLREKTYLGVKKIPIITNVCNFQKALNGKTTLYLRDVETIFHEFGHALHEILSESKYSELSGFGVEWDFVELPSQLMENWVSDRESLEKLAKNVNTGEKISTKLLDKLDKLKTFMTGTFVSRQLEFSLLDMTIYLKNPPKSIKNLDKETLEIVNKYGLYKRKDDYKMYTSFSHIFGGGYSAGYYSYMRAELLEADVFARIKELGMFSSKTGKKLLDTIIGQGTRKKANELFFDFMGRNLDDKAFLERYGI